MRLILGLVLTLILVNAAHAAGPKLIWEAKGLAQPESVVYDPVTDVFYVSNINGAVMQKDGNGFITRIKPNGTILEREWVKGLNAPAGLALRDRTLYVADVDELVEINAASGRIAKRHKANGAIFLNDVAVAEDGTVYVTDTPMNAIWRLKDGAFEPWFADDALKGPNGLLVQGDKLIVASFGRMPSQGQKQELAGLLAVTIEDQSVTPLGKGEPIGNLDGLEALEPGVYLVTDWAAGALYRIDSKGKADQLINLNQGSANLTLIPGTNTVLIPMMLDNTLAAYRLEEAEPAEPVPAKKKKR
ncbi:MAG: SMP-30/gluconolactonase/LRE family protein [Methyloceanibacter sp.]|uniref:SMP-30/gluconolactonase/LRE family protein n=1 Tax=Methyloceanibacter sp. TaxID=1965321 RepID=UPI003D6D1D17